ncbi:GDSL-type esterase/lipase family protein [Microbacterium proteolyticum]|uniref:GDSL-type esterase/lipase family protein n=1 Tax=Microbacterium proteolyticum TaxID=1572644 RepID=UPI0024333AB1|nr:GDSL-type esterase/lipase family protein [Microbacterium proteolyticum]MCI9857116.1 hypothetical protein [Microbacterium proteolyticum]
MKINSQRSTVHRRWRGALGAGVGAVALLAGLLTAAPSQAAGTQSLLALGDSITRGNASCGYARDCVPNNWATGTNTAVNSIAARLRASDPSTTVTTDNYAKSGLLITGVAARIDAAIAAGVDPDIVTLLIGGNDLCNPDNGVKDDTYTMTTVPGFTSAATGIMNKIAAAWPQATVLVASVPNVASEWNNVKSTDGAAIWASRGFCRTTRGVDANGNQLTGTAYTNSVAAAAARATDYNSALASACAAAANDCVWDGGAVSRMPIPLSDLNTDVDYFHPNATGQAKIAATTWNAWGLPLTGTAPTPTPTPTRTPTPTPTPTSSPDTVAPSVRITSPATGTTAGASVTFIASATDNVAVTRVSFWSGSTKLGDATKASDGSWRLTVSTSAYPAGTYSITARASDAAGNEGRSTAITITR